MARLGQKAAVIGGWLTPSEFVIWANSDTGRGVALRQGSASPLPQQKHTAQINPGLKELVGLQK
jgi:hypothetical protein